MTSRRRRWIIALAVLGGLHLATWLHGPSVYRRDFEREVRDKYEEARLYLERLPADSPRRETQSLNEGGPTAHVGWCLPVLPGLLLVQCGYSVAGLNARSGKRLVLYHGLGTVVLLDMWEWIS